MKDLMIDLETFSTDPNAVIVQVGACYFSRMTGEIGPTFLENVDASESLSLGFQVDMKMIYWWLEQKRAAQKSILPKDTKPIYNIFWELSVFMQNAEYIWSHATFDFPILIQYFKKLKIEPYPDFRSARDIRTLLDLASVDPKSYPFEGTKHNALADCIHQVEYCIDAFNILKAAHR